MFYKRAVLCGLVMWAGAVMAQPPQPIVVVQTAAFTGGPASSVIEMTAGARLVIGQVNAEGGVNGQQIELISADDGFDAERAKKNAGDLITRHKPVAMFLTRGTPTAEAMIPVLEKHKIPLIGPSTGAMSLRKPVHPLIFNVRSSYQGEARKTVEQMCGMGFRKVGIIYVDDSFGRDAITGVMEGFQRCNARPLFVEKFDRAEKDFTRIIESTLAAKPPALLLIASTKPTLDILKGLRSTDERTYIATLSTNASDGFLKAVGGTAKSVIVAQVFPSERATAIPLVREVTALLEAARKAKPAVTDGEGPDALVWKHIASGGGVSPSMLEGAAAAKVLVAGLKRCKGDPSPGRLVTALENGGKIDIGWPAHPVVYSPQDHSGVEFADLAIVSKDEHGLLKFRR